MKGKTTYRRPVLLLVLVVLLGCTKESLLMHEPGSAIQFSATGSWLTDADTRTEYSGENVTEGGTKYERINWTVDKDRIRILCSQANGGTAQGGKASDYLIKEYSSGSYVTNNGGQRTSQASISPASGNGIRWGSATEDHYFYALYPAAGTVSDYDFTYKTVTETATRSKIVADGSDAAVIYGTIPSVQEVVWNATDGEFEANMNYAYMYARAKTDAGGAGTVGLSFNPLVTAFEFTLKAADAVMASRTLTTFKLSATTDLTGDFTAVVGATGTPTVNVDAETAGQMVTIDLTAQTVQLSTTSSIKVTVLALPVLQENLTVELAFSDGQKRTLALKKADGTPLSVPACQKMYVSNLAVPDDIYSTYTLEVVGPAAMSGDAQSATYTVKSCKNPNGTPVGVGWTAYFWNESSSMWETAPPSWLSNYTGSSASGSTTAQAYTADLSRNEAASSWSGDTSVGSRGTTAGAHEVARPGGPGTTVYTSNCYVVTAPGWYKFPCVYGNAYDNSAAMHNNNTRDYMLKNFLRHDDNAIPNNQYWIQNNFTDLRNTAKVDLLWQDRQELITTSGSNAVFTQTENTHSTNGRFIYFYVDPEHLGEGNAVIALSRKNDSTWEIVWSWHIWVIEESKLETTPVTNAAGATVEMMTVNLGYCAATEASPRSVRVKIEQDVSGKSAEFTISQAGLYGKGSTVFYQWGRKDPFPGFDENYNEKTTYPAKGTGWSISTSGPPSIGTAIQHPNVFYATTYSFNTRYDNLWNASNNTAYDTDVPVVKTIYDPCPRGFKVPNRNVYTNFTSGSNEPAVIGNWNQGWFFRRSVGDTEGIFFPSTNLRERNTGEIRSGYNNEGLYWTATSLSNYPPSYGGAYLQFSTTNITPISGAGPTGYGFSIRCIRE